MHFPDKTFKRRVGTLAGLLLVPCVLVALQPSIDSLKMKPSTVFARASTKVVFSARVSEAPSSPPLKVRLLRLEAAGNESEVVEMRDDGARDDAVKNDGTYTCTFKMKESIVGVVSFSVEATYPDRSEPIRSKPFFVSVASKYK